MQPPPPPPVIPGYPAPPPNPYVDPPRRNRTLAIWALCLSWIPFVATSFVAVGLGIAVLVKSRREKLNHGKGLAITAIIIGLVVGGLMTAAVVSVVIDDIHQQNDQLAPRTPAETKGVVLDKLKVGDCFDSDLQMSDKSSKSVPARVDVVPCSGLHRYEVYAISGLSDGSRTQTETRAKHYCDIHDDAVLDEFYRDPYAGGYIFGTSARTFQPMVVCLVFRDDEHMWRRDAVRPGGSTKPDGDLDAGPTTQT